MKKGTKSLNVSEATHYRVALLARMGRVPIGEWVERALVEAVDREERKRAREEERKRARVS